MPEWWPSTVQDRELRLLKRNQQRHHGEEVARITRNVEWNKIMRLRDVWVSPRFQIYPWYPLTLGCRAAGFCWRKTASALSMGKMKSLKRWKEGRLLPELCICVAMNHVGEARLLASVFFVEDGEAYLGCTPKECSCIAFGRDRVHL
jgi:hypothetical protein